MEDQEKPKRGRPVANNKQNQSNTPNIKWKGSEEFRHDLFKLEVATHKRNRGFRTGVTMIQDVEHCHFFHSHDEKGHPNRFCSSTAGHTHEITTKVLDDGSIVAECGPAIRKKKTMLKRTGRVKTDWVPVQYEEEGSDSGFITDNHTHEVTYKNSEMIQIGRRNMETQREVAAMLQKQTQPKPGFDIKEG